MSGRAGTATNSWRAPPFIKASAALHLAGGAALLMAPASWPWVLAALAANHAGITVAGLWPRSALLGHNIRRLPRAAIERGEVALTFDDGPDPHITPAVLDLLDAYDMRASFFCIGIHAARHPDLVREIARRGHSIENHTYCHPAAFSLYGVSRCKAEIRSAQEQLTELVGTAPRFFRPPAGLRNPMLDPALHALDLQLVSWTRRGFDSVSTNAPAVLGRLTRNLSAGDILVLHDRSARKTQQPTVLQVLPELLQKLQQSGLRSVALTQALGKR